MTTLQPRLQNALSGRYTIETQLGEGGMAVVFLAHDLRHDRSVAVKVLRPEISAEIGADRFAREIRMAARLTHPHILPVFDSGEAEGLLFYVMPNMAGQSLRERMTGGRMLPIDEALRITREVASALDYAHRQGVIHRDIKPENILMHDGAALVADFGIGKVVSGTGGSITQTGLALGTPAYMSPEQASADSSVDGRSDLYSLGCVLYEMLTGEQPFTGPNAQAIITKRFLAPVPQVRAMRDIPEQLDQVITRSMARTPVDRYNTTGEFAEALLHVQQAVHTPSSTTPVGTVAPEKSIVVLPLANMSADPENEYFSDGMTEEIINALATIPGLQVASRTSSFAFKGKSVDIQDVGKRLGVSSVLEGSVRKIGNRIRIAAQLVSVANGYQLWSQTFDRHLEDVFAIQDEISRAIADALKIKLMGVQQEPLVKPATENLEAYTLYLKGRFFVNRLAEHDLHKAQSLFEQALDADPGYARAYSGIADCWCNLADDWVAPEVAYPKGKSAAQRAIQLEPTLSEAHTSIGKVLCWYEWDFVGASSALAKAVEYNPNYAEAHFVYGSTLPAVGRLVEAIDEMRKALVLDPLSAHNSRWLSRFLLYAERYEAAIDQSHKTLEIEPSYFQAYLDVGAAELARGNTEAALDAFRKGQSLATAVRSYDAMIVRPLVALGEAEEANAIMERLESQAKTEYLRSEVLAMGHAALGDLDKAFAALERAYDAHSAGLIYLHLDPGYGPLRGDPRFAALVKKIGLK
ncbi:MAG: protein kinase domain-containing protein [Gemmatimonadales bacterium]